MTTPPRAVSLLPALSTGTITVVESLRSRKRSLSRRKRLRMTLFDTGDDLKSQAGRRADPWPESVDHPVPGVSPSPASKHRCSRCELGSCLCGCVWQDALLPTVIFESEVEECHLDGGGRTSWCVSPILSASDDASFAAFDHSWLI